MSEITKLSIDVTKIDKSKMFVSKKGNTYLDLIVIPTPNSPYSTHMVVQGLPKADRDAGQKGAILGNAKGPKENEDHKRPKERGWEEQQAQSTTYNNPPVEADVPF
jgi:hypothetical protein